MYLGYDNLKDEQKSVITKFVSGSDVFAILPTGFSILPTHKRVGYARLHVTPTFKTETLRLVSNVQLVKRLFNTKRKASTALHCSFSIVTHDALRY